MENYIKLSFLDVLLTRKHDLIETTDCWKYGREALM